MKKSGCKSIGQVAKFFGISRSTLIYYDRKGVVKPSTRNQANYRQYNQRDMEKLRLVLRYRNAGLSLSEIKKLVAGDAGDTVVILGERLNALNQEIAGLRQQQQLIVKLIGRPELLKSSRLMNKENWVELLRATGLNDDDMKKWHREFERVMPEMHQDFLESLGIAKSEIKTIRKWSKLVKK